MKFLVSVHLPDDFDPSLEDELVGRKIHALNDEIEAAGAMFFVCGLLPPESARTVRPQSDGKPLVTDGPFLETKEHLGGFLIIDAEDMDAALEWAKKGVIAGGRAIEVRQIFFQEE